MKAGTTVTYAADGSGAAGADLAVVVVGERPYAEFFGDTRRSRDRQGRPGRARRGQDVRRALRRGRAVRPAGDPRRHRDQADAIVAAWLPGTEGQGVADVLFGDHKPTGKLSFTWPKSVAQLPINKHSKNAAEALYPFGFGLSY